MFRSKNYKESAKLVDRSVLYDAQDAFKLVCDASKAKFDETVVPTTKASMNMERPMGSRRRISMMRMVTETAMEALP